MPVLDILSEVDSVLQNPAWIMFALAGLTGVLGLAALVILYPFSRD